MKLMRDSAEKHVFQAEVNRMMKSTWENWSLMPLMLLINPPYFTPVDLSWLPQKSSLSRTRPTRRTSCCTSRCQVWHCWLPEQTPWCQQHQPSSVILLDMDSSVSGLTPLSSSLTSSSSSLSTTTSSSISGSRMLPLLRILEKTSFEARIHNLLRRNLMTSLSRTQVRL